MRVETLNPVSISYLEEVEKMINDKIKITPRYK